ncbi:MAG: MGH1-like glycoside hydrolase domain-containing protein [Brevefilum sp.]
MDKIVFNKNSPKTFILAANNWPEKNFGEDQVWSLVLNHVDSHPFHLYTTYGLKARSVQVFPEILKDNQRLNEDQNFSKIPTVTQYTPGFLRIEYEFTLGLAVEFNALTPEPTVLAGTISLKNQSEANLSLQLALISHLIPLSKGFRTRAEKEGRHHILAAKAGNLCPVLFMTGGPTSTSTPFPALTLPLQLAPGETHTATWALAARNTQELSLETARRMASHSWHQAMQQHLMDQARQTLKIQTGNPDWDAAFRLAQTIPYTNFIHQPAGEENPFVVKNRLPDQPPLNTRNIEEEDNLTTLDLNHLSQVLLPQHSDLMASLVIKFVNRIEANGELLAKQNASPYIKSYQEPPLLAGLCLEIYEINQDESFLKKVFPKLCHVIHSWLFLESEDKLNKPFTWQSPDQCQTLSGLYKFDIWEETGCGLDIQTVESPALLAMLMREVHSLRKMSEVLEAHNTTKRYGKIETHLQEHLKSMWNEEKKTYLYRDYQSKATPMGEKVLNTQSKEEFLIDRKFSPPQRLVCHLRTCDERTRVCYLTFTGLDAWANELVEAIKPGEIRWIAGRAHLTSRHLYSSLKSIKVLGLSSDDKISLETADLSGGDITCLAPVWSGHLPADHLQPLLESRLDWEQPALDMGIPELHPFDGIPPEELAVAVNVLWNTLIIQGLSRKGCSESAARLFEKLMATITNGLRKYDGFYPFFQVKDGRPLSKQNTISGLPPIRLFLEIAGVRILSPKKVAVWGKSPFPWPMELNWQGLSITREHERTDITFPDGTTCSHAGTDPVVITPKSEGP